MGRRLRNGLPVMDSLLQPANVNQKDVSKYLTKMKEDQKKHHDRHASSELKELQPGMKVRMQSGLLTIVHHNLLKDQTE